jgi:hypothetical protein
MLFTFSVCVARVRNVTSVKLALVIYPEDKPFICYTDRAVPGIYKLCHIYVLFSFRCSLLLEYYSDLVAGIIPGRCFLFGRHAARRNSASRNTPT